MSVTIPLPPEIEEMLRQRAAASGQDIGAFIREVEEKLALSTNLEKTPEQWAAEFDAWMREVAARSSAYRTGFVVDDDRTSIYEGRGE